jgi:hypothetical protein
MTKAHFERIDEQAPVMPGIGLGGLVIGSRLSEIVHLLDSGIREPDGPNDLVYLFAGGAIGMSLDVTNDTVYMLGAHAGYRGALFEKVRVGSLVKDAFPFLPGLYYDEAEEAVVSSVLGGVALLPAGDDPLPADVPNLPISSILVFEGTLANARFKRGTELDRQSRT